VPGTLPASTFTPKFSRTSTVFFCAVSCDVFLYAATRVVFDSSTDTFTSPRWSTCAASVARVMPFLPPGSPKRVRSSPALSTESPGTVPFPTFFGASNVTDERSPIRMRVSSSKRISAALCPSVVIKLPRASGSPAFPACDEAVSPTFTEPRTRASVASGAFGSGGSGFSGFGERWMTSPGLSTCGAGPQPGFAA
jgi:hypothetical protein